MNKKVLLAETKLYGYLYIITAPFTYLLFKIGQIRPSDDFIFFNLFIALSAWIYLKKIRPLLGEQGNVKSILLFILIFAGVLFSIKSISYSSEALDETSEIQSNISSVESELSDLQDDISNIENEVSDIRSDIVFR